MTGGNPAPLAGTPERPQVEAALLVLERMGLSPADLMAVPTTRPALPTFARYVLVMSAALTARTRRAYGSVLEQGHRTLG